MNEKPTDLCESNNQETTMTNAELIRLTREVESEVRRLQTELSRSYGEAPEEDHDALLLDEAERELWAAIRIIEQARLKVAAYEGLGLARAEVG